MLPRRHIGILVTILLLAPVMARTEARDEPLARRADEILKGNVLCNRATDVKPWFWDPKDGDHTPAIYALEGTPAVAERLRTIMNDYPDRGLDVEDALRVQAEFDKRLKYFIAPGRIADKIHKDVEAGSQLLALTGSITEAGGKKWIAVTGYEPAQLDYPDPMRAPDRPFAPRGEEPLELKIGGTLMLRCILLPAGRFLQGSPFYQRRYQDEYPHEVVLTEPFYMSEIPITQEIFEAVMGKNPSQSGGPMFPVERATFAEILEFCRIVSRENGVMVRLPSDAEWEYAARVGTCNLCLTKKYKDQISETGSRPNSTRVQSRRPNAWGLYDMLCGGWHVTGDYKADNARTKDVDPKGPGANDQHMHRDATGRLRKTRGGPHYDHRRPNIHGAAAENGAIWEGGSLILRVVMEAGSAQTAD